MDVASVGVGFLISVDVLLADEMVLVCASWVRLGVLLRIVELSAFG